MNLTLNFQNKIVDGIQLITQHLKPQTHFVACFVYIFSFFSERPTIQRSLSVSSTSKGSIDTKPVMDPDDLPPLLKHIMSTGSMVEDIERQQRSTQGSGDDKTVSTLAPGLPDLTQPPPNHPAYRGASPQAYKKQGQKSPFEELTATDKARQKEKEKLDTGQSKIQQKAIPSAGIPPQIVSGNLLPMFGGSSSIASSQIISNPPLPSAQKLSPETKAASRLSPRKDTDFGALGKVDLVPVMKTGPLLTPADLISSSSLSSSANTTFTHDQVCKMILPLSLNSYIFVWRSNWIERHILGSKCY